MNCVFGRSFIVFTIFSATSLDEYNARISVYSNNISVLTHNTTSSDRILSHTSLSGDLVDIICIKQLVSNTIFSTLSYT